MMMEAWSEGLGTEHTVDERNDEKNDETPKNDMEGDRSATDLVQDAEHSLTHTHTPGAHTPGAIHTHTHTHTQLPTPTPLTLNNSPHSLTRFPRIIAPNADATKGEAGCRFAASEPKSLSGGAPAPAITFLNSTPSGESAQASTSGTSANWRAAETRMGDRPQEALGGSLLTRAAEDADPGDVHSTQQATYARVPAPAPTTATKSQPRRHPRRKVKAATDAAGEAARAPRPRLQHEARPADVAARADCKVKAAAAGGATRAPQEHEARGEAAWEPLLRLEREAGVTADAAGAASGGRMGEGQEADSDEEPDAFNTYMEIYADNFDHDY